MTFSDIVDAIASATDFPHGRVYMHGRRLQEVGLLPIGAGGRNAPDCDASHAVLILFSLLSGKPLHHASVAAVTYAGLVNDGSTALAYVTRMLESVGGFKASTVEDLDNLPDGLKLAFKSHVTVVAGEQPVIVVRVSCTDVPLEMAFTANGQTYEPETVESITESRSIPGIFIFRLGRALCGVTE